MANINRVVLVGNLTKDPELRHTPSGTAVCKLRLAVNTRQKDPQGNWGDKPNYFDVTVWGNQGESCAQYLSKGRPVGVDGRLDWREWDAQDGTKRQAVEIIADSVQFLGSRQDGEGGGGGHKAPGGQDHRRRRPVPRLAPGRRGGRRRPAAVRPDRRADRERRLRHPDRRRRHSLLMPQREQRQQRKGRPAPGGPIRKRNCYFCREKVTEVDYK